MTEYTLSGEPEAGVESRLRLDDGLLKVKQAARVEPAVRDGGPTVTLDIDDDDLLEVELEDGFVLWTTIDRLQEDASRAGLQKRDDGGFPVQYPAQRSGTERGAVANAVRAVKVLGYDLPKGGALFAADKVESQLAGDGEFFRISADGSLSREDPLSSDEPTLVLIHGTASSTVNAYAGFFDENIETWRAIHNHYEGRVFGFDHRTLTKSPLQNAIEFLDAIPAGANLHLVTHSRGGLVGDLIAHGGIRQDAFAATDVERELAKSFGKNSKTFKAQLGLYTDFNRRILEAAPNVSRFVRVGCPAAGTTLASSRLDVFFSIAVNLMNAVPGVGPFLGGLGELVAAVAKERTDPDVLPGLEAQMPKSAFVRLLNGSEHVLQTDLTVLAGDSDGFLKNLANLFYWRANDLVVDTRSMYGGAARSQRLWHLEENRHVTHVNYFRRSETARVVQRGLVRADGDTAGFQTRKPRGVDRGRIKEGKPDDNRGLPGVILLPGIMGSNLAVVNGNKRNRIWLDISDLMRGRGRKLAVDSGFNVQAAGVLDSPYAKFRNYLVRHNIHVMPMAYDWRLSLEEAASLLNNLVTERLAAAPGQPLHLVAHSMGGLVASLFMRRHPDTWQHLRDSGGRLVQAGTPNLGSYVIPRILQGKEQMIRLMAAIDADHGLSRWTRWTSRFNGLLELAPSFGELNFSRVHTWNQLDVMTAPTAGDLRAAQSVKDALVAQNDQLASEGVLYVAGGPNDTPVYDPASQDIRFTERGDGRVTWDSGIPPGAPTWYIPTKHGSLLDKRGAFAGLRELILSGQTTQLVTEPPAASSALRSAPDDAPLLAPEDQIEFIPSVEDLEEAALGMETGRGDDDPSRPPVTPCNISVSHGDLRFSNKPLIVGHYRGDQIVNAEQVLDDCLGGALRSRHQLGIYPGKIGTAEVLLRDNASTTHTGPNAAIVLGLGNVGELTPGGLTRSVETGLLRYAQACRESGKDTSSLKLSALLVGTGEAGISVRQTLESFLLAVRNANRALQKFRPDEDQDSTPEPLTYFSHIEFLELYKDLALEALHVLHNLPDQTDFTVEPNLVGRSAGRRRARMVTPGPWWSRVQIRARNDDLTETRSSCDAQVLKYTFYGERARAPVTRVNVQPGLVDQLVSDTLRDQANATGRLPQALFELLVPPSLKSGVADRRKLQLVLDETSAAYPWELLTDRRSTENRPVGIGTAMLRQLMLNDVEVVSHPEDNRILVVGDPRSGLQELPGAQLEANTVGDLFSKRADWDVVRQIQDGSGPATINASSVIQNLLTNDVRILHLAGHGIYDAAHPMCSGMVIGGSGKDGDPFTLITAAEVRQMRLMPELVFINCCHLGRIERTQPYHKLAANLASQFIRSGVKAVVAAGWAVNDDAAATFCSEFYQQMLDGEDFGTAVALAREKTYHHESNTWGAYQCYGDPGFRLMMDVAVRARVTGKDKDHDEFIDASELVIELGNLRSSAKVSTSEGDSAWIARRYDKLWRIANRKRWLSAKDVVVGFARVVAELENFGRAIELYEQASQLAGGGVTLTDLEQLANSRSRFGYDRENRSLLRTAVRDLEQIIKQHGPTSERMSLLGSANKRFAPLQNRRPDTIGSVRKMTEAYVNAAALPTGNWFYPASNALLGVLLLGGPQTKAPRKGTVAHENLRRVSWMQKSEFKKQLEKLGVDARSRDTRNFWDIVARLDFEVLDAIFDDKLKSRRPDLAARYLDVFRTCGSKREIGSVVDHWKLTADIAQKLGSADLSAELKTLAADIEE